MCSIVEELAPKFEATQLDCEDVYTYLHHEIGRTRAQTERTSKGKYKRLKKQAHLNLGKGANSSSFKRGCRGSRASGFITSKGLRAQGGGRKAIFDDLYPGIKQYCKG